MSRLAVLSIEVVEPSRNCGVGVTGWYSSGLTADDSGVVTGAGPAVWSRKPCPRVAALVANKTSPDIYRQARCEQPIRIRMQVPRAQGELVGDNACNRVEALFSEQPPMAWFCWHILCYRVYITQNFAAYW